MRRRRRHTVVRAMEVDVELLHPVVDHVHLVVAHHPDGQTRKRKAED
jgi:hypothetical protein